MAIESTGTYWPNLFVELIYSGMQVIHTNVKFTKNINRKTTDILDCQWIHKIHSLGLLPSSFLPDVTSEKLRTLCRRVAVITATARKLAVIIWKIVVERVPYTPPDPYEFIAQKRSRKLKEMRRLINKLNIAPLELGMDITKLE